MIDDILKESGLGEFFMEEGIQKGLEQGRSEGRSEGLMAATRQLARDAVAARFPAADAALLDRISTVTDNELLRRLILTLADFPIWRRCRQPSMQRLSKHKRYHLTYHTTMRRRSEPSICDIIEPSCEMLRCERACCWQSM